jgi:hypothetical protein
LIDIIGKIEVVRKAESLLDEFENEGSEISVPFERFRVRVPTREPD